MRVRFFAIIIKADRKSGCFSVSVFPASLFFFEEILFNLDLCEGGSFWTVIFNSNIQWAKFFLSISCFISLCPFVASLKARLNGESWVFFKSRENKRPHCGFHYTRIQSFRMILWWNSEKIHYSSLSIDLVTVKRRRSAERTHVDAIPAWMNLWKEEQGPTSPSQWNIIIMSIFSGYTERRVQWATVQGRVMRLANNYFPCCVWFVACKTFSSGTLISSFACKTFIVDGVFQNSTFMSFN